MYRGSTWCDDDRVTARREAKARHAYEYRPGAMLAMRKRPSAPVRAPMAVPVTATLTSAIGWPDSVSVTTR